MASVTRRNGREGCANQVLATMPYLMRFVRTRMRSQRHGLSVPQFRTLIYIQHSDRANLSSLADHLGLSLPAVSRLVGGLVRRGLVNREICKGNRRCLSLSLTVRGRTAFRRAQEHTRRELAARLSALSDLEVQRMDDAMRSLLQLFGEPGNGSPRVPPLTRTAGGVRS